MNRFLIGGFLGLMVGSAINALCYRWSKGVSMWNPKRSFCPSCKKVLAFYELVPILSFLVQRGKCRGCHAKIAWRYPIGEIGHGLLWGFCALRFSGWEAIAWFGFISFCWVVLWTDVENFWIPDEICALLFFLGIILNGVKGFSGAGMGIILMGVMGLIGLVFLKKDAVGHGDIKLMRGIGACLLVEKTLTVFILAVFAGAFVGSMVKMLGEKYVGGPNTVSSAESLPSYLKCFLGYVLGVDILALLYPRVGEKWFGFCVDYEEYDLPTSALPFGSFLVLGAYGSLFFQPEFKGLWERYLEWVGKNG